MTASPEVLILDVGHGNCSIIRSDGSACVVDAPAGSTLLATLRHLGISCIDTIILSHADKDHVAGVNALLTCRDIEVKSLYVNPDATKGARSPWMKLRTSVRDARQRGKLRVVTDLTSDRSPPIVVGAVTLEILAPSPELILGGAGATALDGKTPLTSNSMSVVIRVTYDGEGIFLLPGDLDGVGLLSMMEEGKIASAKVLLFPHHGGLPGDSSPEEFVRQLCHHVQPELVVFSNSRESFANPRHEIVTAIRAVSAAKIACTQLSKTCLVNTIGVSTVHLHDIPASGKKDNSCCAGSVRFNLDDLVASTAICLVQHQEFVLNNVTAPLCNTKS